jgi:hypothetical protein
MELHAIGHASLYLSMKNLRILIDPVLQDPHQEGLFDIFPGREVLHDRFPPYDLLVISHQHLDHFDIRSLSGLRTDVPVLIPEDPLMVRCLKALGFTKVKQLGEFAEVTVRGVRIVTTRSENCVPELGFVFADESGVLWNQVDTIVSPRTAEMVTSYFPIVDLVIAAWQPMLESNFQTNRGLAFPAARYSRLLRNLSLVAPRAVVPGANAFCYTGASAWMNQAVFPVTRERFLRDVQAACPALAGNALAVDPGDSVIVDGGQVAVRPGGCPFVRRTGGNPDLLRFSPVELDARLIDPNPDGIEPAHLRASVLQQIESEFAELLQSGACTFATHRNWGVEYQLVVVFPDGRLEWHIDFASDPPRLSRGRSRTANMTTMITGSAFHGLATSTRGWDYVSLGGFYRHFSNVYTVSHQGLTSDSDDIPGDPLEMLYPYNVVLSAILDRELVRWSSRVRQSLAG